MEDFSDAALILVGHGSTLNAESSLPTYQQADELRRRQVFAQVQECFWKQEPGISGVMRGIFAPRVFVVPLFISEGYFTGQVIPRELGLSDGNGTEFNRVQSLGEQTIHYCGPVGTHDSMTKVLLARAREVVQQFPFPRAPQAGEISLFIAGHGTSNNENSRKAIERQVECLRALKTYAMVEGVFMEEEPGIADCCRLAVTRHVVVVPFFISDGLHTYEDIPVMLGETETNVRARIAAGQPGWRNPTEKKERLIWYARGIGGEPLMADVILERAREMAVKGL
jgi:sirohydrochlorin cobaltochelatase